MLVREFYEKMKGILIELVVINLGAKEVYIGYLDKDKVYQYLYEYRIEKMYIGSGDCVVLDIVE